MAALRRTKNQSKRTGRAADLLVVGLGNPGDKYRNTRHNVGVDALEILAARRGERLRSSREQALTAECRFEGMLIVLAFPTTFMNETGRSVQLLMRRYGIEDPERLIVIQDELDLAPARVKVKLGGGLAGHNGLRSIRAHIQTTDFGRVRIGVGKPPRKEQGASHVLRKIPRAERAEFDVAIEEAADAVEMVAIEGYDAAMAQFNREN